MPRMFSNSDPHVYGRQGLRETGPAGRRLLKRERVKHRRAVVDRAFVEESLAELAPEPPATEVAYDHDPECDVYVSRIYGVFSASADYTPPAPIVRRGLLAFVKARKALVTAMVLLAMTCGCASNRRGVDVQVHVPDVNTSHPVVGATARVFVDFR